MTDYSSQPREFTVNGEKQRVTYKDGLIPDLVRAIDYITTFDYKPKITRHATLEGLFHVEVQAFTDAEVKDLSDRLHAADFGYHYVETNTNRRTFSILVSRDRT
jgi:hypothetical protein